MALCRLQLRTVGRCCRRQSAPRTLLSNHSKRVTTARQAHSTAKGAAKQKTQLRTMFLVWSDDLLDIFDFPRLLQRLTGGVSRFAHPFRRINSIIPQRTMGTSSFSRLFNPDNRLVYIVMSGSQMRHQTRMPDFHNKKFGGVRLVVVDSRGELLNSDDLCETENFDETPRCFIYLKDFAEPRFSSEDIQSLRLIEERFGCQIWDSLTVMYTHCDAQKLIADDKSVEIKHNQEILRREFQRPNVRTIFLSSSESETYSVVELCELVSRNATFVDSSNFRRQPNYFSWDNHIERCVTPIPQPCI